MNKYAVYIVASLLSVPAFAGLITHQDYTPGGVISSAGQNTNENAIVNEFNGNIDHTNIKAAGIETANLSSTALNYLTVDVRNYGAKCDGTTDDTSAIQTAVNTVGNGGQVKLPKGTCKISSAITLPQGVSIVGTYHIGDVAGSELNQVTSSTDVIVLQNTNQTGVENTRTLVSGLRLVGGRDCIDAPNGSLVLYVRDVFCDAPSNAGFETQGFTQQDFFDNVEIAGPDYAILASSGGLQGDNVTAGTPFLFDKNVFNNIYINNIQKDAIRITPNANAVGRTGTSNMFNNFIINTTKQNGVVLGAGLSVSTFNNFDFEAVGNKVSPRARTTLTITVGASTGSVASVTGLVIGDTATVSGGNTNGTDWYPYITNIVGSVLTFSAVAPQTLTAVDFSPAIYSGFVLDGSKNNTFIGCAFASDGGSGEVRYAIDNSNSFDTLIIGGGTGPSPIYDPSSQVSWMGTVNQMGPIRDSKETTSSVVNATVLPSSGTWGDVTSLVLPAGDWQLTACYYFAVGTSSAMSYMDYGIGTHASTDITGLFFGSTAGESHDVPTGFASFHCIPAYDTNFTSQTTFYAKVKAGYFSGAPTAAVRLSARRFHPY